MPAFRNLWLILLLWAPAFFSIPAHLRFHNRHPAFRLSPAAPLAGAAGCSRWRVQTGCVGEGCTRRLKLPELKDVSVPLCLKFSED